MDAGSASTSSVMSTYASSSSASSVAGGRHHSTNGGDDDDEGGVEEEDDANTQQHMFVVSGGGPGFMAAANGGASMVPGARSIGMGITLPFEAGLNPYVTPELAFTYHYFFTRKFALVYYAQALVVAPGGVGTIDEMMEVLTLRQTGKLQKGIPIVLLGERFWKTAINWQFLVECGVINQSDVDDLFFTDSVEDAFRHVTKTLTTETPEIRH